MASLAGLVHIALALSLTPSAGAWRALVVGGGAEPSRNQVGIEKNTAFADRVLPTAMPRRVLFADGQRNSATVQYLVGRQLRYRAPQLVHLDAPATQSGLTAAWRGFATANPGPLLLYFAGHGSPNPRGDLDDNTYELWGGTDLDVRRLAAKIAELPQTTPVVVVMTQCFSGAFANLLFEGGRPDAPLVGRDLVGFFAATNDRTASGCTPEINEADYEDFSTYFFAALSGHDRLGRVVRGADFDGDGFVGMDEAFLYATEHQQSTDVPVSTADAFLRRYVTKPDRETMATPYSDVLAWAHPAQRAVLEALSANLRLRGEDRLRRAYVQYASGRDDEDDPIAAHRLRFVRLAKSVVLEHTLRAEATPALIRRFDRLRAAEHRNPLNEAAATAVRTADDYP